MRISDELAMTAMRVILPDNKAVRECGFRKTGPQEWRCWTDTYDLRVYMHNSEPMISARVRKTGVLSLACILRPSFNVYGKQMLLVKRKLLPRELSALPDYII